MSILKQWGLGRVNAVACSYDSRYIAAGGTNIRVFNLTTFEEVYLLTGHTDEVTSLSWSSDNERLASASLDSTIRIWNMSTGRVERQFSIQNVRIYSLAWHPDGRFLASGSSDNTIRIWDVESETLVSIIELAHTNTVSALAWYTNGSLLVSGSLDGGIKIWQTLLGYNGSEPHINITLKSTQTGHLDSILSLSISPDRKYLLSSSTDNTVKFRNITTGELLQTLSAGSGFANAVIWLSTTRIAAGYEDGTVAFWNLNGNSFVLNTTLQIQNRGWSPSVLSLSSYSDGKKIALGCSDSAVRILDAENPAIEANGTAGILGDNVYSVSALAVNQNGSCFALADGSGTIRIHTLIHNSGLLNNSWKLLSALNSSNSTVYSLSFSPNSSLLAAGYLNNSVDIWCITPNIAQEPPLLLYSLTALTPVGGPVTSLGWSDTGDKLIIGLASHQIRVWNLSQEAFEADLMNNTMGVNAISIQNGTPFVAAGAANGIVRIWNLSSSSLERTLETGAINITSLAWSPDSLYLAAGTGDGYLKVWDTQTWNLVLSVRTTMYGIVYSISWALGSGYIKIFNTTSGNLESVYKGHNSDVLHVAGYGSWPASQSEGGMLSFSRDGVILFWGNNSTIKKVPDRPDISINASGQNWTLLKIALPLDTGNLPITSLRVYSGSTPDNLTLHHVINSSEMNVSYTESPAGVVFWNLSDINAAAPYYIKVSASNELGEGPLSKPLSLNPRVLEKPGPPIDLRFEIRNRMVLLSWQPPQNSEKYGLIQYRIYRYCREQNDTQVINTGWERQYNDTGVTAGYFYMYNVSAITEQGESNRSNTVQLLMPTPPTADEESFNKASLLLGVLIIIVLALLIGFIIFLLRRRKREQQSETTLLVAEGTTADTHAGRSSGSEKTTISGPNKAVSEDDSGTLKGQIEDYKVIQLLAHGGFSAVYEVEKDGKRYAMKIPKGVDFKNNETVALSPEDVKSYQEEAAIWKELTANAPESVVALIDAGVSPFPWFVMEKADATLEGKLPKMSIKERLEVFNKLLINLEKIHKFGVIHKDIKPQNILLVDGTWKFTDFGLSKTVGKSSRSGQTTGTPGFMAPEQVSPGRKYGHSTVQTDIWGMGVVLYYMITNKLPFEGSNYEQIGMNILFMEPKPPSSYNPELPKELDAIVMKALAKEQGQRVGTAKEMREEVERVVEQMK
ncbi:MAG: protein kinase [Thermoplasmata archaeon]